MSERCLHCERPLPLLQRLRGDGEFCSKEHKRIYEKEHAQLALARLMQAQPSAQPKPRPAEGLKGTNASAGSIVVEARKQEKIPELGKPFLDFPAARPITGAIRSTSEPRWKPAARTLPPAPSSIGKMLPGLCSFLRRETQAARPEAFPEGGRVRLGAVPFPQTVPRMDLLAERLHRTDCIGFTFP